MTRAVRVIGAALGLLLVAAPIASARAQEDAPGPTCPPVAEALEEDRIRYERLSPTDAPALTEPAVDVGATFRNVATSSPFGEPFVQRVEGRIVACNAKQLLPEAAEESKSNPDGENGSLELTWAPVFETNGTYAIVFDAFGRRPNGVTSAESQHRQVVQHITIAVPPKKPTNVAVSDPTDGIVTVRWDYVDPEPDLLGFEIQRARQGTADYATINSGIVDATVRSVSDAPPVGAWRYRVVAYRAEVSEGEVSRDDTVEVAESAPSSETTGAGGTSGSGTSGGGTGTSVGDGSATTVGGSSQGSPSTSRASVDLSQFAAALNARRTTPTLRIEPPDPGFQETLPFDALGEDDLEGAPAEVGADEPNVGLGQRLVTDPGERQRSLGFVAFGLLLFVLSMTGLFVKSEVKRADLLDLDAIDADDEPATVDADIAVVASAAPLAPSAGRRRRRPEPMPEPIAEPVVDLATTAPTRRRRVAAPVAPRPTVPAKNNGSAMAIPETRRRWGQARTADRLDGQHADPPEVYHDFDDLSDEAHAPAAPASTPAPTRRRTHRSEVPPLDAPGLDVPDPGTPMPRARTRKASPKAPLPARAKATSSRR